MLIDLTCPVEVFRTVMPTEEIPAVTLTLFNLSDRVITSAEVLLRLTDGKGGEIEQLSFRGRALNGRPHSTFLMSVPCAPGNGKAAEATIRTVWFADNETWRRDPERCTEYTPNNLPVSPALTNLRFVAGETAVGFPSLQEKVWVCVCGRANALENDVCVRCGQSRETVFARFSPEAVAAQVNMRERQLELTSRSMREDTIRLQRIREEEYREQQAHRRRRKWTAACLGIAACLATAALLFAAPQLRLAAGKKAMASGNYARAKETFLSLGEYGAAKQLAAECDWQNALSRLEEAKDPEALREAAETLRAITDKPEAAEKANETDLLRGRLLLEKGDWPAAEEAAESLPGDWPGRSELLRDCRLAEAREKMAARDWAAALSVLQSLEETAETKGLASECRYMTALEQMADEKWDEAIETLSRIPEYRDSRSLTLECHYRKGRALEAAGEIEQASGEYLLAGDWDDAKDRMTELTFRMAESLFEEGNLKEAQALYASIPDHEAAAGREKECRYLLAKAAADVREYGLALELLEGIDDDYENTAKLRAEAAYQRAKTAVKQEDWDTAVSLLGALNRASLRKQYRDIESLYLTACAGAGIDPYPETPEPETTPEPTPSPAPTPAATPEPEAPETEAVETESLETEAAQTAETPTPDPENTLNPFLVTEDEP